MSCFLCGCKRRIARSSLSLSAVLLIFLIGVCVNLVKTDCPSDDKEGKLLFVAMIHRHGDRTPVSTYSTDPYIDYPWPGGFGALTTKGTNQLYNLGMNVRARFGCLKPANGIYTQETVHAIASSPERTRMSGASMLAAFWEPYPNDRTLPIQWQPVPLQVIPAPEDYILYQAVSQCLKYDQIFNKLLNDPDPGTSIYQFNEDNSDLYEYLSQYIGENVTNCLPPANLYDTLFIEKSNGLELPAWTDKVYPKALYDARVRAFQLSTETDYMKMVRGGPIITEIFNLMEDYQFGYSGRNIITYAAHDTTISNALTSMKMAGQTDPIPDYGALLAYELRSSGDSGEENIIQMVYYANTSVLIPQKLKITDCPDPCYFSEFGRAIEGLIVTNYTQSCELS